MLATLDEGELGGGGAGIWGFSKTVGRGIFVTLVILELPGWGVSKDLLSDGDEGRDLAGRQEFRPVQFDLCLKREHLLHRIGRELVVNFLLQ